MNTLTLLFYLLMTAMGLALIGAAARTVVLYGEQRRWRVVAGRVRFSGVSHNLLHAEEGGSPRFWPEIEYEYTIDQERYISTHLSLVEHETRDSVPARRIAERYTPGQAVPVYYNPAEPWEAVLQREFNLFEPLLYSAVGLVMVVYGLAGLF